MRQLVEKVYSKFVVVGWWEMLLKNMQLKTFEAMQDKNEIQDAMWLERQK